MDKLTCNLVKLLTNASRVSYKMPRRCNWGLSEVNRFTLRQHNCGDLGESDIGKKVTLYGWIQNNRFSGKFLVIGDSYGATQLVTTEGNGVKLPSRLPVGSVIKAEGVVRKRPKGQETVKMKTGKIEVVAETIEMINLNESESMVRSEPDRLKHRYVDLRSKMMQSNLRLKSQMMMNVRNFMYQEGFIEVETPLLQKHTPGGAHEFIVPTSDENRFYCLAQSPQIFKQLLMVGGVDRYFQIARCIRDEVSRPDRQPEFSQIDLEMSFTSTEGIIDLVETLLVSIWPATAGSVSIPFPRLSYKDALALYGSDKPDLRSDIELKDVTDRLSNVAGNNILALNIPRGLDDNLRSKLKELTHKVKTDLYYEDEIIGFRLPSLENWESDRPTDFQLSDSDRNYLAEQLKVNPGDYLFLAIGDKQKITRFMGKFRNLSVKCMAERKMINDNTSKENTFVWILDFPLFCLNNESGLIECTHHPFSAPKADQIAKLYSDPLEVLGDQFDLVLNGEEIGGGSMRIHNAAIQEYILKDILKSDTTSLQFFLAALKSGCPPHGGIALGLDRLVTIMCKAKSIRDVIAFPKSFTGKDALSGAPTPLPAEILKLYHQIKC